MSTRINETIPSLKSEKVKLWRNNLKAVQLACRYLEDRRKVDLKEQKVFLNRVKQKVNDINQWVAEKVDGQPLKLDDVEIKAIQHPVEVDTKVASQVYDYVKKIFKSDKITREITGIEKLIKIRENFAMETLSVVNNEKSAINNLNQENYKQGTKVLFLKDDRVIACYKDARNQIIEDELEIKTDGTIQVTRIKEIGINKETFENVEGYLKS